MSALTRSVLILLAGGTAAIAEDQVPPVPKTPQKIVPGLLNFHEIDDQAAVPDVVLPDDRDFVEAASRRRQELAYAPQPVTVLNTADLVSTPAVTIPDRLRYVAGIDVYQSRNGQFDIGMRGYNGINNNRVVALVDGREFRWEVFGSVLWSGLLNLSDISRIEIAKGPSSVSYGANAFGGVISLKSRDAAQDDLRPEQRKPELYTLATIGSGNRRDVDATALGPLGERFYFKAGAGGTWLDDLPGNRGNTNYVPDPHTANTGDTDLQSWRYNGLVGWRIADGYRLEGEYYGLDMPKWEFVEDLDVGSNFTSWQVNTGGVHLLAPWGEVRYLRQWADYDYSNQKAFYAQPHFRYAQAGFNDITDTVRAQLNFNPLGQELSVGVEFFRWQSDSNLWAHGGDALNRATWAEVVTTNHAAFIEDQWKFAPGWAASAGVRVDDNSRVGTNTSPRVALNYAPDKQQFWLLSYSSGYRLPTAIESYLQDYYFSSDPNLKAEKIQALELGWQRRLWNNALKLTANGYYNQSNDQIWILPLPQSVMQANFNTWNSIPLPGRFEKQPGPYFSFQNLDNPVDVYGLESSAEYTFPDKRFALWTNGTYQVYRHRHDVIYQSDGIDVGTGTNQFKFNDNLGREVNAPPRWKANLGLNYDAQPWFFGIVGRYVDSREVFTFANSQFPEGILHTQKVPSYLTCDLTIGFDFGSKQNRHARFIRMSISDVFNNSHYEWYQASSAELGSSVAREQQLTSEIGRSFSVQMGWDF